jgi:hypothetical protein
LSSIKRSSAVMLFSGGRGRSSLTSLRVVDAAEPM